MCFQSGEMIFQQGNDWKNETGSAESLPTLLKMIREVGGKSGSLGFLVPVAGLRQ